MLAVVPLFMSIFDLGLSGSRNTVTQKNYNYLLIKLIYKKYYKNFLSTSSIGYIFYWLKLFLQNN